MLDRLALSDATWERMAPLINGRPDRNGSAGRDNPMLAEGVLWLVAVAVAFDLRHVMERAEVFFHVTAAAILGVAVHHFSTARRQGVTQIASSCPPTGGARHRRVASPRLITSGGKADAREDFEVAHDFVTWETDANEVRRWSCPN